MRHEPCATPRFTTYITILAEYAPGVTLCRDPVLQLDVLAVVAARALLRRRIPSREFELCPGSPLSPHPGRHLDEVYESYTDSR